MRRVSLGSRCRLLTCKNNVFKNLLVILCCINNLKKRKSQKNQDTQIPHVMLKNRKSGKKSFRHFNSFLGFRRKTMHLQLNQGLGEGHCKAPAVQVLPSPTPPCPASAPYQLTAAAVWSGVLKGDVFSWQLAPEPAIRWVDLTCSTVTSSLRAIVSALRASMSLRCSRSSSSSLPLS